MNFLIIRLFIQPNRALIEYGITLGFIKKEGLSTYSLFGKLIRSKKSQIQDHNFGSVNRS